MELFLRKGPEPTTLVTALAALRLSETRLSVALSWVIGYHTQLPATLQKELQATLHLPPDRGIKSRRAATAVPKAHTQESTSSDEEDELDGPQDEDDVDWEPESEPSSPKSDSEVKPELGIHDLVDTASGKIKIVDIRTITDQPKAQTIFVEDVKNEPGSSPLYPCRHCEATFESAPALSVHDMFHAQVRVKRVSLRQHQKVKEVQVTRKNKPRVYGTRRRLRRRRNGKVVAVKKTGRSEPQRITNPGEELKYRNEIPEEEELEVQFKCELCSSTFPSMQEGSVHVTQTHTLPVPCELCESRFRSKIEMEEHQRAQHPELLRHKCDQCENRFVSLQSLDFHSKTDHLFSVLCDLCKSRFKSRKDMEDHQKAQHPELLRHKCDQCENRFVSLPSLDFHSKTDHLFSVLCDLCKSRFKSRKDMEEHQKAQHPELLRHKCDQCENRFVSLESLKYHRRTEHRFPKEGGNCGVCGKFFTKHDNLRAHLRWNHVDPSKLLLCPTCGIQVKNNRALKDHMLNHAPRTFICQTCGFGAKTEYQLMKHMGVHSTERPHKCSHCPQTFKNGRRLKLHVDRHLGKGIKACKYCGVEKSANDLFNHILIVHRGRKFRCSECSALFSLRAHLKNHFTLKHPAVTIPADADLEVIYTKTPEVTSTPVPPPAKRSRGSESGHARARATEAAAFTALSCPKCPRATFHTRTDFDLHLLRHEKDPEYRMRHRVPVRRLGQSPSPGVKDSDSVDPDPPQLPPSMEQPTQQAPQFPLEAAASFDNAAQYQPFPNIQPFLQLHQPAAALGYGYFPNYDPTILGNGHLFPPGNQG